METVWLNGEILPLADATIGIEDRGFQFADGVYEVIRLYNGRPFALGHHLDRLERSCEGIQLGQAFDRSHLQAEIARYLEKAALPDGMIYLQITRGVAPRNHLFPKHAKPTVLFYTRPLSPLPGPGKSPGVALQSVPDERWRRCWIKSIALLANVLAKHAAISRGADEAVFIEDGLASECSASNLFAILRGALITHPVGPKVLPGITRLVLLEIARELNIPVIERPLAEPEAIAADELFITSTTRELNWVRLWNGKPLAAAAGPLTLQLHEAFAERVRRETAR